MRDETEVLHIENDGIVQVMFWSYPLAYPIGAGHSIEEANAAAAKWLREQADKLVTTPREGGE